MNNNFGQRLQEKLDEHGIKAAELSRRSGVTKQNISRLINNTPHPITNALPTTEKDTVEKLAKALHWDLDEALLAAGHAPTGENNSERNPGLNLNGLDKEDIAEIVEFIEFKQMKKKKKKTEKHTVHDEFDLAADKEKKPR